MPLYDYNCTKCNTGFEVVRSIDERMLPTFDPCPNCNEIGYIEKHVGTLLIADRTRLMGMGKNLPQDFRDRMKTISKNHPGNTLKLR